MEKGRFKVIKGGGKGINNPLSNYIYKKGYVTNTRLMGVIAMKLYWETEYGVEYIQFFHLDWEEYGIDGFESLGKANQEDIEILEARIMGGLGGQLVEINKKEAIYLLKEALKLNTANNESLPELLGEYEFLLNTNINMTQDDVQGLWDKMCVKIETEIQLVNYYLMRAIGNDVDGQKYLSSSDFDFTPTGKPSTLIKNTVEFSHRDGDKNYYRCEAVIDYDNGYQLLITHLGVKDTNKGLRVDFGEIKNRMKITTIEASFQLKKPEYILVYEIDEFEDLLEIFDENKPYAMQNVHQSGFLFTEFNPNNEHVKDSVYYLNGDIYAVYYVTTGDQLVVGTFDEKNLKELKRYFRRRMFRDILEFDGEFKIDTPLLYEFVQSGLDDFYDFIDGEE